MVGEVNKMEGGEKRCCRVMEISLEGDEAN